MCGITGIYAYNMVGGFNMINIMKSANQLYQRGPDNLGSYHDETVAFGHTRLSVIDTSEAGNQPMWDSSGRYAIIYNGEIYNFKELRSGLESKGVRFKSSTDTEVVLNLFIIEGQSFLNRLNGFFSFAIYDSVEKSVFLARDRFGIKPLYYFDDGDKFLFASELKAIMEFGIQKQINFEALELYLQLNYIPAPFNHFRINFGDCAFS